ncbi:wall-associated receptor kinase 2-like [Aegilops tauschii subsp. strangulata]|uniref:Protein kinase domain-containing protein n=2 Tax=Aegilops tauschii TaxID=37682 RepID=A0A453JGH8_AEGTS|nr:wall-associated receptor kinase 2-like [Aegilops tauschii subsp. strangulata]
MGRSLAFLLPALLLAATVESLLTVRPDCQESCGGVDIPYPFGIGAGCFRPGFEITCLNNTMPVLPASTGVVRVLTLLVMPRPEARVMLPVSWTCYNSAGNTTAVSLDGRVNFNKDNVYRISNTHNQLFVLGCNTFVYTMSWCTAHCNDPLSAMYTLYSGCTTYCNDSRSAQDGACAGVGCCHVDIPPGIGDNLMKFDTWSRVGKEFSPCDYAFIVEKGSYTFRAADLHMEKHTRLPLRLDWAIRDSNVNSTASLSCAQLSQGNSTSCVSDHSECVDSTNGPGYVCNCTKGYEGNPYLPHGCTNIDECARPREEFPCKGECRDTAGSYSCTCHPGYRSNGDPRENPCNPNFTLAAKLAIGISLSVSLIVVALLLVLIMLQKRKLDKVFEKNGGRILQNVKGLTIFSKEGLKKNTKNNSEFLGNGSFGKVYKGTLPDNTMVAVKASIKVNEATKQEFAEEVEIHSHMIHKNILKLIGCCLEVDVPMLVYEFAANGSLGHTLHGNKKQNLPLDLRLEIAIGSAEGLRYMHLYTTQAIRHGDIKPDNILLDDNLTPKISDFGLSMLLKEEYFAKKVVGCMGYIDPVFMKTGLLTQKSDVYSFGAVLLELITGKENVYDKNHSLIIEFCKVFEKEKTGRAMFDKEIVATGEDIFILEEIGKLAIECLKEDIEDRPDMTEVAERLVMLRRERKLHKTPNRTPSRFEEINMEYSPNNIDRSGTSSATCSVPSTPTSKDFNASP